MWHHIFLEFFLYLYDIDIFLSYILILHPKLHNLKLN